MDIIVWKSHINNLHISDNIKELIITFFMNYKLGNSLNFIKIKGKDINHALNNINNYKTILLCMDAEFQSAITGLKYIKELGMLVFIRDNNKMYYYVGFLFVNFRSVTEYGIDINDLRPIFTTYSTVSYETLKNMKENEKEYLLEYIIEDKFNEKLFKDNPKFLKQINSVIMELNNNYIFSNITNDKIKKSVINSLNLIKQSTNYHAVIKELDYIKKQLIKTKFDIFGTKLKTSNLYINFLKSHDLYWNDKEVLKRTNLIKSNKEFFNLFNEISENSLFIVKGAQDFLALNNMVRLFNYEMRLNFTNYYDIETFNGLSSRLYASSQLENTYKGIIKTKIYKRFVKPIFDVIGEDIGGKAHNPVVDSLFTVIVAVTINIGLNDYFES